ncbi:MAG: hypothetical protein WCU88_01865 [Elusimicrobiota bacterium]|jgi:hypothetical protein
MNIRFYPIICSIAACGLMSAGCAQLRGAIDVSAATEVCLFEGDGKNISVELIDGAAPKWRKGILAEAGLAEAAPGRHLVAYSGLDKPFAPIFTCKADHRYRIKAGEVEDSRYGSRRVYMVVDVETQEVLAAQK